MSDDMSKVGARCPRPTTATIRCACDADNCPASLELIPEGKFMRLKSGGVTTAIDMQRALEIIGIFSKHFNLSIYMHVRAGAPAGTKTTTLKNG
jgi:hypothetical protein